ncbi:MAG TPA: SDR family NAD(P)-dependent oxidoreductase, partial [Microbacterium sp.]|nr:SDR family NAD(P)-dependent oxidoreductase [Microbacterium sp.]
MRIEGSSAIVFGGASGLGGASARELASRGASVVIADVNEEAGAALASEIGARFVRCDVTDEASVAAAVEAAGSLRIGLNCA